MKRNLLLLSIGTLLLAGCAPTPPQDPNQVPVCKITEPTMKEIKAGRDLIIKGEGSDADGRIAKTTLTVGGKKIAEVTAVPFTHTVPAADLIAGKVTIRLEVEDDKGAKGSDEIEIEVVQNLSPTCKITEPANRARIVKEGGLTIKGIGTDEDGTIVKVSLKINDDVIDNLPLPLDYRVEPENLSAGAYEIIMEVTDDQGATGSDKIILSVMDNLAPVCAIGSPVNNSKLALENGLTIIADGSDPEGQLKRVTLKVGGQVISSVNSLPINHRIEPANLTLGSLKIELEVEDAYGATDSAESTVEIIIPSADEMLDPRDGKSYKVVKIGTQYWTAENMGYLPVVHSPAVGSELEGNEERPFYYVYDYDGNDTDVAKATQNYKTYGVLYDFNAAKTACPTGWRLPDKDDWNVLYNYVHDNIQPTECYEYDWQDEKVIFYEYNISGALKSTDGWEPFNSPGTPGLGGGSDQFGFAARPSGKRLNVNGGGGFWYIGQQCNFWIAGDLNADGDAPNIYVDRVTYNVSVGYTGTQRGHAVRCIKNQN